MFFGLNKKHWVDNICSDGVHIMLNYTHNFFVCLEMIFISTVPSLEVRFFRVSRNYFHLSCARSRDKMINKNKYFDTALLGPCTQDSLFYWFTKIKWINMNMIQHKTWFVLLIYQKYWINIIRYDDVHNMLNYTPDFFRVSRHYFHLCCARSRDKIFSCVSKLSSSQLYQVSRRDDKFNHIFWQSSFRPCTKDNLFYWFTKIKWIHMNMIQHKSRFVLLIYQNKVNPHEHDTTQNTICSIDLPNNTKSTSFVMMMCISC